MHRRRRPVRTTVPSPRRRFDDRLACPRERPDRGAFRIGRGPRPVAHLRRLAGGAPVRLVPGARGARGARGHRQDEGDRQGDPGGRAGLPQPAVPHARRVPRDHRRPAVLRAPGAEERRAQRDQHPPRALDRVPPRCAGLDDHRLRGHVAGGAGERPDRERRAGDGPAASDADRLPRRRRGRDVHGRARAVRRHLDPDHLQGRRHERPGRLRLRRRAAGDVHAGRRRHLHEGRRRRRGPRRQDRAGHPRGRSPERRHDRRQRRGQRRRLRRAWRPTSSSPTR